MKTKTDDVKASEMTLRDHFAALAMQARIITLGDHKHDGRDMDEAIEKVIACKKETAVRAYQMADAMMAERSTAPSNTKLMRGGD